MKNLTLFFLSILAVVSLRAQVILNVTDFGAVGDGATMNTTAIQATIDSCSKAGGGEVVFAGGTFLSNTIRFKSNVTLRVTSGTILRAQTGMNTYPDIPYNQPSWSNIYTQRSLIFAEEVNNIRITGGGTIEFAGQDLTLLLESNKNLRPFGIRMHKCTNITIDSIRLENAPQWMLHIFRSNSIIIRNITIFNHGFASNDGINIDACTNVLIEDCDVDSNDDPIVIKSHSEDMTSDVLVRRCTVATFERAVKVGNESLGPFERIRFEDITVNKSAFPLNLLPQTAIYLAITDGGSADGIEFERINITTPYQTPIFIRLNDRGNTYVPNGPKPPVQFLKNVLIKDVQCTAGSTIPNSITAIPGYYVENVILKNIAITIPGGGSSGTVLVPEEETKRPENDMWGEILPAYGFYIRHVKNLTLDSVCFILENPDSRSKYVMEDTLSGITVVNDCDNITSTGAPLQVTANVIAYPNPAKNELYLKSDDNIGIEKLSLFDATGNFYPVSTWWNADQKSIRVDELSSGMYWVQLENKDGMKKMVRFVKN